MAQDRTGAAAGWSAVAVSKIPAKRGLLPPSLACFVSAATKARGTTASSTPAREAAPAVRTTSMRRGWSTTATSGPPAKSTWPLHQPKPSPTTWAPNGPMSSGPGIELRVSPPPPPVRPRLLGPLEGGLHHPGVGDG